MFSRRRTVLEHSSVILAVECCKLGVGQSVITALFIVAIATSAKLPPGQYMVLEHSSVISAVEHCKLGVGQSVITALFIVAIATSAKLPPGQYVPADDKLSIYLE